MRADAYDDVYFSHEDGLAETRHVFFAGNDLSARMAQTNYLCIAETGFGSGLNLLALMAEMTQFPDLHVDFLSVEAHPLDEGQMAFVHEQFPELELHATALRAMLPPRWPGQHVVALLGGRLSLHLLYGAADTVLPGCDFRADCWFLDGFSPAKNPDFWSPAILRQIGRLTAGDGTVSSFTAATAVRDGLTEAGFTIEKRRGFGRKRDMIVGRKDAHAGCESDLPAFNHARWRHRWWHCRCIGSGRACPPWHGSDDFGGRTRSGECGFGQSACVAKPKADR